MSNSSADAEAILQLEREWSRRLKTKDVDWIVDLFATNGRQFPPGNEAVVGRDALRAAWEQLANTEGLEISWEPSEAHVSSAGDMAYDFGTATIRAPDGRLLGAKYVVVWVREEGKWKVAADIFNNNAPPTS